MMYHLGFVLSLSLLLSAAFGADMPPIRSAAQINDFLAHGAGTTKFAITGDVQNAGTSDRFWLTVRDETARAAIWCKPGVPHPTAGDKVEVRGYLRFDHRREPLAVGEAIVKVGTGTVDPALTVKLAELNEHLHHLADVCVEGTVIDIVEDEVDTENCFLLLKDGETIMPVAANRRFLHARDRLIGALVRLTGSFHSSIVGIRKFSGPYIGLSDKHGVDVIRPTPADPFAASPLETRLYLTPREIARMDSRSVRGLVIATWGGNRLMVKEPSGRIVNVELAEGLALPNCSQTVVIVGYPQTDLYRINLAKARYRPVDDVRVEDNPAEDITAERIVANNYHRHQPADEADELYHGRLLRLTGIVRSIPTSADNEQRMLLDSGRHKVPVDLSSNPDIAGLVPLGSEIEVTGRCLLETDNWRADKPFPQIKGFVLIPRTPADIRILARPPWWTPGKLLVVIGLLFAVILALFVRNRLQKRFGKLKVAERTRLAVELHDTLAQNLTGVSMELEAANDLRGDAPPEMLVHVDIAAKALKSCRGELRNCLLDLRSQALEEPDMTRAVRRTLQPLVTAAHLGVRFNVPRTDLSDNTAHALLRVIRELVGNAIRHGKATSVKVAGTLDNDTILCSVADNGCGFDPDTAPGVLQGHFGLQGIRERIQQLGGTLKIESAVGCGTKAVITIKRPQA